MSSFIPNFLQQYNQEAEWLMVQATNAWAYLASEQKIIQAKGEAEVQKLRERLPMIEAIELPEHFVVLPTGLDLQTHLRFPGQEDRETLLGGVAAAFSGGYDTLCTMPNTKPFLDSPNLLTNAIQDCEAILAKSDLPMQVVFTAAGTLGMKGEEAADVPALVEAGAIAITDDGWGVRSDEAMEEIFRLCAQNKTIFMQHAEMPGHKGVATASEFQQKHSLREYPRNVESEMIKRDLKLLRKYPEARYHVLHVSTRESLDLIRDAKAEGLPISCEVTPHHLFFSNVDIPPESDVNSRNYKMNPPLFAPEDRAALVEALADGTIDCVSTDHAPHTAEDKADNWTIANFGTRGLETTVPVLFSLLRQKKITMNRLVEVFSTRPREILADPKLQEAKGLLFVDPKKEFSVSESYLPGISKNSCFLNANLQARIEWRAQGASLYKQIHP